MAREMSELQKEIQSLSAEERAALAYTLLDSLDEGDEEVEQLWLEEARRRFAAYSAEEIVSRPAAEVFAQVRARLRRRRQGLDAAGRNYPKQPSFLKRVENCEFQLSLTVGNAENETEPLEAFGLNWPK